MNEFQIRIEELSVTKNHERECLLSKNATPQRRSHDDRRAQIQYLLMRWRVERQGPVRRAMRVAGRMLISTMKPFVERAAVP